MIITTAFTFQYGSTLMKLQHHMRKAVFRLYIPIWFYFNGMSIVTTLISSFFTFQYGSTLMRHP